MEKLSKITLDNLFTIFASPEPNTGCWIWLKGCNGDGYGVYQHLLAHRHIYSEFKEPIVEGNIVHHKCLNSLCVNYEDHLEQVSHSKHREIHGWHNGSEYQTHCLRGHEFTLENTYLYRGARTCRQCRREYMRARRSTGD